MVLVLRLRNKKSVRDTKSLIAQAVETMAKQVDHREVKRYQGHG